METDKKCTAQGCDAYLFVFDDDEECYLECVECGFECSEDMYLYLKDQE